MCKSQKPSFGVVVVHPVNNFVGLCLLWNGRIQRGASPMHLMAASVSVGDADCDERPGISQLDILVSAAAVQLMVFGVRPHLLPDLLV